MELEQARQFIREHHRAVLATHRPDGQMQMSPVVVGVDEAGRVTMSTRETAFKTRNLLRDPRASLCVFTDGFFGQWIQMECRATVVALPEAMEGLVDYYRRSVGEHPDWAEYRTALERERRVLVQFTIEQAGPDKAG